MLGSPRCLFVGGLRRDATEEGMRAFFEGRLLGRGGDSVEGCVSFGSRGYGFVHFSSAALAQAVLVAPPPSCGFYTELLPSEDPGAKRAKGAAVAATAPALDAAAVTLVLQVAATHSARLASYLETADVPLDPGSGATAGKPSGCGAEVLAEQALEGSTKRSMKDRLLLCRALEPAALAAELARDPNVARALRRTYVVGGGVAPSSSAAAVFLAAATRSAAADAAVRLRVQTFPPLDAPPLCHALSRALSPASGATLAPRAFTHLASAVRTEHGVLYGLAGSGAYLGRPEQGGEELLLHCNTV